MKALLFRLDELVNLLAQGKKLIFVEAVFSNKENEGHGDPYMEVSHVAPLLHQDEILYVPLMNSGFISYKLEGGVPKNDYGFIDCLHRLSSEMGYKLKYTYRDNFAINKIGINERALVIEFVS